jgi:hypothetical protein
MVVRSAETPEIKVAADHCGSTVHAASDTCRTVNVRRVADAGRRHGFTMRKKL